MVLSVSEMFLLLYPFNHNPPFSPNILTHRKTTTSNGLIRKKKKQQSKTWQPFLGKKMLSPIKVMPTVPNLSS